MADFHDKNFRRDKSNVNLQGRFIGLGIMGKSMADHLLAGGHELHVFNSSPAQADDLLARGAIWHDAPGEVAAICDVVITMVG